jgi:hypothetical protein
MKNLAGRIDRKATLPEKMCAALTQFTEHVNWWLAQVMPLYKPSNIFWRHTKCIWHIDGKVCSATVLSKLAMHYAQQCATKKQVLWRK